MKVKPENLPIRKRMISAMFNFGIANVMTKIVGFLLIPIYTRYLTPEDYGIVEMCASLAAFSTIFMRLGVPGSVSRFYFDHKDNIKELNNYVKTVHTILIFSSITVGIVIATLAFFFSKDILPGVLFIPFLVLVIINSGFSANSDLQKRLLQSKEESAYMAKLNIATSTLGVLIAIFFVAGLKLGALGLILSQSSTSLIFFIQAQFYLRKYTRLGVFKPSMLKNSMRYGAGLLPHHLFAVLAPLVSKGILNYKESTAALGIFSLAMRFIQPLDILYNTFAKAFGPIYFSLRNNNEEEKIKKIYTTSWYGAIFIFSIVCLFVPPLIPLLTPERFHQSAVLVPIMSLGFVGQVLYLFFIQETFYSKKTKYISVITGTGLLVNLLLTSILVEDLGVNALAIAYSSNFVVTALVSLLYSDKVYMRFISNNKIVLGIIFITIIFIISIIEL